MHPGESRLRLSIGRASDLTRRRGGGGSTTAGTIFARIRAPILLGLNWHAPPRLRVSASKYLASHTRNACRFCHVARQYLGFSGQPCHMWGRKARASVLHPPRCVNLVARVGRSASHAV